MFAPASVALAVQYGITPVYATSFTMEVQYAAATRTIYVETDSDLVHEVAHFLVATDAERLMDEYGLGSSPDAFDTLPAKVKRAKLREECASLLGILIERQLQLTHKGKPLHAHTWAYHSWDARYTKNFRKTIKLLTLWGLVRRENGRYIPCL